jgi:hypothetical protein
MSFGPLKAMSDVFMVALKLSGIAVPALVSTLPP